MVWIRERLVGRIELDQFPQPEQTSLIRYPSCLLNVIGINDNRVALQKFTDQSFNPGGIDRIQSRTWFVHQDHLSVNVENSLIKAAI